MFDFVGVFILCAVIALFCFLTTRAWKMKNSILKWAGTVISGLLTVLPSALLVLALIGFYKLNEKHSNPVADIHVTNSAAQIARGQQLAHLCAYCHSEEAEPPLSGSNFLVKFGLPQLGTFYAPNLTPSGNIKDWTDGEVIRAIREGVHKNGRSLLFMSAGNFRYMSDDDVQAVVAYLRSQPATGGPTPDNQFNVLGALFINVFDVRFAQPPVSHMTAPPPGTPEYGKYMVGVIGCQACHGGQLEGKLDTGQPGPPPGPNLTKIVPQWTEEQFMNYFNTGQIPGGGTVPILTTPGGYSEPRMPWPRVRASTTDDELRAIYAYLHSLAPVEGPTQ